MTDKLTPELEARLRERLAARSERLARMAATDRCPTAVLSFFAQHVATTAMLLFGDRFANDVLRKLITCLRESNGICMCGNGLKAPAEPLCRPCIDQVEKDDRECEEHLAMYRPTKGQPS